MALATWWRDDQLPTLSPIEPLHIRPARDRDLLACLTGLNGLEIQKRLEAGHQPYAAFWDQTPVAYGWVARRRAAIGELDLDFWLPPLHRYLWDFATLPAFRGRGIYPRLLQGIVRQEMDGADYFWIIRAPENGASGAGIRKAGFKRVGQLSLTSHGRVALVPRGNPVRAAVGAEVLDVPLATAELYDCWHCGGAAYPPAPDAAHCLCRPGGGRAVEACLCLPDRQPAADHRSNKVSHAR